MSWGASHVAPWYAKLIYFMNAYIFCLIPGSWGPQALAVAKWLIRPWLTYSSIDGPSFRLVQKVK